MTQSTEDWIDERWDEDKRRTETRATLQAAADELAALRKDREILDWLLDYLSTNDLMRHNDATREAIICRMAKESGK